jgi:replicative superfamily II helicase
MAKLVKDKEEELYALTTTKGYQAELEQKQLDAFKAYQLQSKKLDEQADVSEAEKEGLEELKMIYEAIKEVKNDIILGDVATRLADARTKNGLAGLATVADDAADKQAELAKKMQEFPGDEPTSLALTASETEMHLIQEELDRMGRSTEISVKETASIRDLADEARVREAYNRIYAESLPIARSGTEMEFEMYFEALAAAF